MWLRLCLQMPPFFCMAYSSFLTSQSIYGSAHVDLAVGMLHFYASVSLLLLLLSIFSYHAMLPFFFRNIYIWEGTPT